MSDDRAVSPVTALEHRALKSQRHQASVNSRISLKDVDHADGHAERRQHRLKRAASFMPRPSRQPVASQLQRVKDNKADVVVGAAEDRSREPVEVLVGLTAPAACQRDELAIDDADRAAARRVRPPARRGARSARCGDESNSVRGHPRLERVVDALLKQWESDDAQHRQALFRRRRAPSQWYTADRADEMHPA